MGLSISTRIQSSVVALIVSLVLAAPASWAQPDSELLESYPLIHKSPNDKRDYRYLRLENELQVLLISDVTAEKSAAALDVNVGSGDDPSDRGGLAHFLEHMLFLGTAKYPEAGEYQAFISKHSGSHNAYTSPEHTNYFFNIDSNHFDEALDRFAQFFVAPLFTREYVDRERNAVNSEYKSKIKNDYRRQLDVYRQLVSPSHPMVKFSVGSLDTLADRPQQSVRKALLDFYRDYYSSHQMTLVVLGRESLDDLEGMIRPRFELIEQGQTKTLVANKKLFKKNFLPARVSIEPIKDVRRLSLVFPVASADDFYRQKPLQYLGNLLGHEGEGSLLSLLKELGWAEGLSAGAGFGGRNQGAFNISISLTPDGLVNQDKVVATTFKMIEKIRNEGVESWRFDEQKQLADIAYRFAEKSEPAGLVSGLANKLHRYSPEDVIRGAYAFDDFDASLIDRYLARLNPTNLLWMVSAKGIDTDKQSQYYQTPYQLENLKKTTVSLSVAELKKLKLPEVNHFIPSRLAIKSLPTLGEPQENPTLLHRNERVSLWHKQEASFSVPRSVLNIRALSPSIGGSAKSQAAAHLYAALVKDALNEYSYPATLAGLAFAVSANSRGLDITLSGYSDRQGLLLSRILDVMKRSRFDKERFNSIKRELQRHWQNASQQAPYEQLMAQLPVALYAPLWTSQERAAALQTLSYEELQSFALNLWRGAQIKLLMTGNLYAEDALKLGAVVEAKLQVSDLAEDDPAGQVVPAEVVNLKGVEQGRLFVEVDHQDVAAVYYVQALGDSVEDRAATLMMQQMLRPSFFNQLRTEKQLGYLVFVSGMQLKDVAGTLFVVQSPAFLLSEVEQEIRGYVASKAGVVEDFAKNQQALITALTQAPKNLQEQAGRYWSEILGDTDDFDRRAALIAAIEALTPEVYAEYSSRMLGEPRGLWLVAAKSDGSEVVEEAVSGDSEEGQQAPSDESQEAPAEQAESVGSRFKVAKPTYRFP